MNSTDFGKMACFGMGEAGADEKPLKSKHRIGFIGSDTLFHSLKYELEVVILSAAVSLDVLKKLDIEFVLIESSLSTVNGYWDYSISGELDQGSPLCILIDSARKHSIPVVFWNTLDWLYVELFSDIAEKADFVFASDEKSYVYYLSSGIDASLLPPCVSTTLFNPYNAGDRGPQYPLVYDGIVDAHRLSDRLGILTDFIDLGLIIVDSGNLIRRSKIREIKGLSHRVKGCIPASRRADLLRNTEISLHLSTDNKTPLSRYWRILESAACQVPVLYHGKLDARELLYGITRASPSDVELIKECVVLRTDALHRESVALSAWREVAGQHTLTHRLADVFSKLGLDFSRELFPKISIVSPTRRPELIEKVIRTYEAQTYPNKEIVLLVNSPHDIESINYNDVNIKIIFMPEEQFTGSLMRQGIEVATGDYIFKMDDDDCYGPNYVMDLMLHQRATDAGIFGKPPSHFVNFSDEAYCFKRKRTPLANRVGNGVLSPGQNSEKLWIGGNSICGSKQKLLEANFPTNVYGSADTSVLLCCNDIDRRVFVADPSNLITCRNAVTSHTWRESKEGLTAKLDSTLKDINELMGAWNGSPGKLNQDVISKPVRRGREQVEQVAVGLASIPSRESQLLKTLTSLLDQIDRIYVYLNGYSEVPVYLQHEKISVYRSQDYGDLGAAGKFFKIDDVTDGYYFSADDDIVYPPDYIEKCISTLKKYDNGIIVAAHGSIFAPQPKSYFDRLAGFSTRQAVDEDKFVTLVGTGCAAFYRGALELRFSDFYPDIMCDLRLSTLARDQGVPMVTLQRPKHWLEIQEVNEEETYYYKMQKDPGDRTRLAGSYDWSYATCGAELRSWLEHHYPGLTLEASRTLVMDTAFIRGLHTGIPPKHWNPLVSSKTRSG